MLFAKDGIRLKFQLVGLSDTEKDEIGRLIRENGGEVRNGYDPMAVTFTNRRTNTGDGLVFHVNYIHECLKSGKLLDLNEFDVMNTWNEGLVNEVRFCDCNQTLREQVERNCVPKIRREIQTKLQWQNKGVAELQRDRQQIVTENGEDTEHAKENEPPVERRGENTPGAEHRDCENTSDKKQPAAMYAVGTTLIRRWVQNSKTNSTTKQQPSSNLDGTRVDPPSIADKSSNEARQYQQRGCAVIGKSVQRLDQSSSNPESSQSRASPRLDSRCLNRKPCAEKRVANNQPAICNAGAPEQIEVIISSSDDDSAAPSNLNLVRPSTSGSSPRIVLNRIMRRRGNSDRRQKRNRYTRSPNFTSREECIMVAYLIKKKFISAAKGNRVWKQMIHDGFLVRRTYHSLNNHFRRYMLPVIQLFRMSSSNLTKFQKLQN